VRQEVRVRDIVIGGTAPITVQSMTNTDTRDVAATIAQIQQLQQAGCEIVRLAVLNSQAAAALPQIRQKVDLPLVADIHFDYRLALAAIAAGFDKLRLNPGNMGDRGQIRQVAQAAKAAGVPIRIGINSASLEKELLHTYGGATPEAMVASALKHIAYLEAEDFNDIIVSLKAPDLPRTVAAYRLMAAACHYPLHIGITHAGSPQRGIITSAAGLAILLAEGLGDTLRVSLTGDPVTEVETGWRILASLELREYGVRLISCPTCGRCQVDLAALVTQVEELLLGYQGPVQSVAVMGCEVNGPGEAQEVDLGIAAGQGMGLIFRRGEVVAKVAPQELLTEFRKYLQGF